LEHGPLGRTKISSNDGLISQLGRMSVERAKADGSWISLDAVEALIEPDDFRDALDETPAARQNNDAFPPGARKIALTWIYAAKRVETRAQRIAESVRLAGLNVRANDPRSATERRRAKEKTRTNSTAAAKLSPGMRTRSSR